LFLDRMDEELFRKAYAQRPQSSIVSVANQGVRRLVNQGHTVVAQVHDSIVLEVLEEQVLESLRVLEQAMSTPVETWGGVITIPVELKVGYSWGDLHEVDIRKPLPDFTTWRRAEAPRAAVGDSVGGV